MKVSQLRANPKNPRKISQKKINALKKSLDRFGDLSGIVYNIRTKRLVSGHQRSKVIPDILPQSSIKIDLKHDKPTRCFTVAEGYIMVDGERYRYREVDAPEEWEAEAMIAANKHGGDWDRDNLAILIQDFPNLNLDVIGFDISELHDLDIEYNPTHIVAPVITGILGHEEEVSDEDYLKSEKKESVEIDRERLPNNTVYQKKEKEEAPPVEDINPFENIDEEVEIKNKQIVIIISCKTEEQKQEIREKIRPLIKEAGAELF